MTATRRGRLTLTCAALSWLLIDVAAYAATGWPTYRADIGHHGITSDLVAGPLQLQWEFKPLAAPKPAWPLPAEELPRMHSDNAFHAVIVDDVVYFGSSVTDRVLAVDAAYGGISPHGYLVASSQTLFVPSGRAMPAAFDRSTGKFLFSASPSGKRGGTWTLLDQDRLIAGTDAGGKPSKVSCDTRTGKLQEMRSHGSMESTW